MTKEIPILDSCDVLVCGGGFGGISAALAAAMSEASGYPVEPVPEASANAGFKDWFLQCFRRPAFTIEMGIGENPLPMTQLPALCRALRAIMTTALLW